MRNINRISFQKLTAACSMALIVTASLSIAATSQKTEFEFSSQEANLTHTIIQRLNAEHYRNLNIDDGFSENLLDSYLTSLDPQKIYFTQEDIKRFTNYKYQLDDLLIINDHSAITDIYNTFHSRYTEQLRDVITHFDRYSQEFDQQKDFQSLVIDAEKLAWPKNDHAAKQRWLNFVHNDVINLKLADKDDAEIKSVLTRRYQTRLDRFEKMESSQVYETFINSLTGLYDPHTNWLSPQSLENFKINMSLSLEGIGAVLQKDGEHTKIVRLVSGGPASKQGDLRPGDKIIAVSQNDPEHFQDVVGWRLDEVVQLIRGTAGTKVILQVQDNKENLKNITIERDKVSLEDQAAKKTIITLPGENNQQMKIGVIDLPAFYMDFDAYRSGDGDFRSTTRDVYQLIKELKAEKIDGLIIDLRNNGGGSLREATSLTDLFLDRGPIVQIRSPDNHVSRRYRSQNPPAYTGPLLVFINHFSASASEIFAGAIQDYRRGLVVGEQSYGKGTVQTLSELKSGQLKLTTAKFYRVSGDSTQNRGIIPDIAFPSMFDFEEVGESALDHALPWDQIHRTDHIVYPMPKNALSILSSEHQQRMKKSPDYQYLLDRIDYVSKQGKDLSLALNHQVRLNKANDDKARQLTMVNKMRKNKSEKIFKTFEDYESYLDNLNAERNTSTVINIKDDFLLQESAQILADYVELLSLGKEAVAKTQ